MTPDPTPPPPPSFREAFLFWLKLGFISFGGPAGQIAVMHQELVERRRWISERRFLHALNYCMVLPGPEAQQLATYIGWLLHRTWGGIVAGGLFVLPSLGILIALSWIYLAFGHTPLVAGLFYGIKPAVTAIVLHAAHRIGSRALKNRTLWAIAAASFIAIFVLRLPFPLIVLSAGLIGAVGGRLAPDRFAPGHQHGDAVQRGGARRRPAAAAACAAPLGPLRPRRGRRPAPVDGGDGRAVGRRRPRRHADPDGMVLHQGGAADLRRRLRGAALRVPGRGRAPPVAQRPADDRRPGAG
jgi:chromate transport protein ChrA